MTIKPYTTVIDPDSKKATTAYPFTIFKRPGDCKWILCTPLITIGQFLTKADAEDAMRRYLNPEEYHYDQFGNPIP